MTVNQHLELLSEIEKMPSESISELLQIVRFFRQNQEIKNTSLNAWNDSINKLDDQSENSEEKKGKIQKLWLFGTYYAKSFLKCQARKTLVQKLSKFLNP